MTTEVVLENVKVLTVDQGADERNTGPRVASSVTVEVTSDGANKIALARTIGSLSLSLRSAVDDSIKTSGLTTVGSFGGNTPAGIIEAAANLFTPKEEEKKKFTTVIVTRRLEAESYSVPVPEEEEEE